MRVTRPAPTEVHVWCVPISDPPLPEHELDALLSGAEKERLARLYRAADRRRGVVGRGVLRLLLGACEAKDPSAFVFDVSRHGRPFVRSCDLGFNVSHSGDWVLIALSGVAQVGVDVEQIRTVRDMPGLAHRFFAPSEARELLALPAAQRTAAFFACWTRKEAFVKALGTGLQTPLDRFAVSLRPGERATLLSMDGSPAAAGAWMLHDVSPAPRYAGAVAVAATDCKLSRFYWTSTRGIGIAGAADLGRE